MNEELRQWIDENCFTVEDALHKAFEKVWEDGEYLKAECCGKGIRYWSGLLGPDMAKCIICGNEIRWILSPHVSPILIDYDKNCTSMPNEEFIKEIGDKQWQVIIKNNSESEEK